MLGEVWRFLVAVVSYWQGFVTGGVLVALFFIFERLTGRTLGKRAIIWLFIVAFFMVSCFLAWRDQLHEVQQLQQQIETNKLIRLAVAVDLHKVMTIRNEGGKAVEDVDVFVAEFVVDSKRLASNNEISFSKIDRWKGALFHIDKLQPGTQADPVDLAAHSLKFYPLEAAYRSNPQSAEVMLTHYCLRVRFRDAINKKPLVYYRITSALKDFPLTDGQEQDTLSSGNAPDVFRVLLTLPSVLRRECRLLYDDRVEEYTP